MNRRELINRNWKFTYGDPEGATLEAFDDGDWYDVGLPHSFGIPYFMETGFYVGRGVYRRTFDLTEADAGKYVALEFHGVFQDAEITVNGVAVDRHLGGYTAFVVDVSEAVRTGTNQLTVRVSNEWNPRLAPRAGEHVFNGGIYRDVSLIIAERTRIAWYGTGVVTLGVGADGAGVEVTTELVNDTDAPFDGLLAARVTAAGTRPLEAAAAVRLPPRSTTTHRQPLLVDDVRMWHPDSPHLYTLEQTLRTSGGAELHRAATEFGIRTIEFTATDGFHLNGERFAIHGANVHQDHAGWSDAVTHAGMRRDVALIKDAGMNFIRGSHYPHHEQFATECDRLGVLYWSEAPFWGIGGANSEGFWNASAYPPDEADQAEFEDSCLRAMEEMIRVNRNHPSIVAWSTGNEVFFSDDHVVPAAKKLTRRLVDLAHDLDPTRPAAVGGAQRRGFDELGDLAGYNGDGGELFLNPPWPNIVSEYGSVVEDRPGSYTHRFRHGSENEYAWRSGVVLWCGFHHGSIVPDMGRMGFVDYFRLPLRSWYWYRHRLTGTEPPAWPGPGTATALRITADRTTVLTDGTDDVHLVVEIVDDTGRVVADERPVRIEVVEGGGIFPTGTSIELTPAGKGLLDGRGAIEFRSYHAGPNRLRATAQGLAPCEILVEAVGPEPWTGQRRNLAPGPPAREHAPDTREPHQLAEMRPVFSSGSRPDRPARLVTDHSVDHGWISATDDPGAWLSVDLEGLWSISTIHVEFGAGPETPYVIELSDDGRQPVPLAVGTTRPTTVRLDLDNPQAHAVRVTFPQAPAEVINIRVHGH
ncbi:glycoside hydrolase family 2 protein [Streptomyces shenzhenensis]|uniref:glycoside hydrolase family 2 protein n=1 Tax=Streptomyces shenzhenensis TaxID=943815 RepID=UPI0015F12315|nr:glycoside hydrolase family 2 TIM barrel-domain containing protein [Streptomyces shenzhenensis]